MTPEELDEARAKEALREADEANRYFTHFETATLAARLAREGWTPPEPVVDPDVLAFREWVNRHGLYDHNVVEADTNAGKYDSRCEAQAFLAGARMAREQERERAKVLEDCVRNDAARLLELAAINNFDETVADAGITSGMVCRQEIEQIARSLSAILAKYRGEA